MCRYNLGHHMLPSNKFLLYDHSLRIPMVIMGPGIQPNSANEFLGTQVCEHLFDSIHTRDEDECTTGCVYSFYSAHSVTLHCCLVGGPRAYNVGTCRNSHA